MLNAFIVIYLYGNSNDILLANMDEVYKSSLQETFVK